MAVSSGEAPEPVEIPAIRAQPEPPVFRLWSSFPGRPHFHITETIVGKDAVEGPRPKAWHRSRKSLILNILQIRNGGSAVT